MAEGSVKSVGKLIQACGEPRLPARSVVLVENTFLDRFVQQADGAANSGLRNLDITGPYGTAGAGDGGAGGPADTLVALGAFYRLASGLFGWQLIPPSTMN